MADITFYNHGNHEIMLKNKRDQSEHRLKEGAGASTTITGIQVGDCFEIENLSHPRIEYRPLYIVDEGTTEVKLQGNVPFGVWDEEQKSSKLEIAEFESNRYGIDLTTLNPRLVVSSFSKKPIFEGLSRDSVDYEIQSGKIIKTGMTFSETHLSKGNSEAQMSYSYSAFSKDWNLNVGGSATVPTKKPGTSVRGSIDFGYSQFEREERSSTNVYAYTREQKAVYEVGLDPRKTYLDWEFVRAVKRVERVEDAMALIQSYGTHYPTKVYYGGDRSAYLTMNSTTYAKAKGYGLNIKGKLAVSQKALNAQGQADPKARSNNIASGSLGFGYSESREEKEISQQTKGEYWAVGGAGGFESWTVTADDAVAVAVDLEPIYDLIDAKIFKDGTSQVQLAQTKALIQQAVEEYLDQLEMLDTPLPAPRVYSLTLDRLEATEVVDDLEKRTSGLVIAKVSAAIPSFDGVLWHKPSASSDFEYKKNRPVFPNVTKQFVQFPSPDGSFEPCNLHIEGDIAEKDHVGSSEHHTGQSAALYIGNLETAQSHKLEFDCKAFRTHAEKGTIRVTATLRREPSGFSEPWVPFGEEKTVSPAQDMILVHTKQGASSSHTDSFVSYKAWNGDDWTARINEEGKFFHQQQGASAGHVSDYITYQTWGGSLWTAKVDPARKMFTHVAKGQSAGHESQILQYISWDESNWTMKIQ